MKTAAGTFVIGSALAACGCGTPPSAPASSAPPTHASAEPAPSGRIVRVVRIDPTSVEAAAKTDLATAKKWGADPANAKNVLPVFRHILVKAASGNSDARAVARRKAEELIARLDRGEAFASLAKSSDDPGSANTGGAYPGRMVKSFVVEIRRAYAELRPGERARAPVETQFGWHVVEKGPIDDDACADGHRKWLAQRTTESIGRDLTKRLRHVHGGLAAAEVERAFGAVLGGEGKKLDSVPSVVRMPADTCDGFASIARGDGVTFRDDVLLVATLTDDERDASEVEAEGCEAPSGAR